jgi:hypothetical protein
MRGWVTMAVVGTIVADGLRLDRPIEVPIVLRRLHCIGVSATADGQPGIWTLIDFICPDDEVGQFADALADALQSGPWYADLATESTKYVVFSGRVFAFDRKDRAAREEAVAYARLVGVPEAQIDWPR